MSSIYGVIFVLGIVVGIVLSELLQKLAEFNYARRGK